MNNNVLMIIQTIISFLLLILILQQKSTQQSHLFNLSEDTDALFKGKKIKNKLYIYNKLTWLLIIVWFLINFIMIFK